MASLSSTDVGHPAETLGSSSPDEKRKSLAELRHLWEGRAAEKVEQNQKQDAIKGKVTITWKNQPQSREASALPLQSGTIETGKSNFRLVTGHLSKPNKSQGWGETPKDVLEKEGGSTFMQQSGQANNPPVVVRGSMLVQNTIDVLGWPRLLDVVETSDSDEGIVVEENTNLFHGKYFQARQNPVYFSDIEDDGDSEKKTRKKGKAGRDGKNGTGQRKEQSLENNDVNSSENSSAKGSSSLGSKSDQIKDGKHPIATHTVKLDGQNQKEILRIVDGSPSNSVRQTITVERTDEDLTTEMKEALLRDQSQADRVVNVDVIQESVDVELSEGVARVNVKVVCERVVQTRRGAQDFRKTCVTVTRLTEVDMLVTPERRHFYERIVASFASSDDGSGDPGRGALVQRNRLSADDIYRLYTLFVEVIAESGVETQLNMEKELGQSSITTGSSINKLDSMRRKGFPITLLRLGQGLLGSSSSEQ